jgi:pimeloyl-ACP methyl ester carboxylesterase
MDNYTHQTAPTQFVEAAGIRFAYRRFANRRSGAKIDIPLLFFMHFTGTMDHWDPALTDGFAQDREVILFDNAGVASSSSEVPTSIEEMAQHAAAFIDALGIKKLDALGFSLGGLIAQQFTIDRPDLVRKLILVGTGPRSGEGMASLTPEAQQIFGAKYDPADELWLRVFFTPSKQSQAAGRKYLERQRARKQSRDPLPNEKVAPAAGRIAEMGRSGERSLCLPEEDRSAHARGERQQRRDRLYGELFHPPAKPAERAAHSVPRQQSWCAVPIPRAVC